MVMGSLKEEAEVAVIGAGPGGYVAAIRAADLGKEVVLIDDRVRLGGVCTLEGCIPSKVLISAVELAESAKEAEKLGLRFKDIQIDTEGLRGWMDSVVEKLTGGISALLKRRGVEVIRGSARFDGGRSLAVEGADVSGIEFRKCVIATGSRVNVIPPARDKGIWTSTEALRLPEVPERLVVIGGGYIGLELGLVYAGLGSRVTVVEFSPRLLPGADFDLVDIMVKNCEKKFESILYESKVTGIEEKSGGYIVTADQKAETLKLETDQVLLAVGRLPNTNDIGLDKAGIKVNERGFIEVDAEGRTSAENIFAIGDVTPGPMLAHKASREAHVVAEVIAQMKSAFDNAAIPAVVFTKPEIAWAGLTEREAEAKGIKVEVGRFPLRALGRGQTIGQTEGMTKVIAEPETGRVLGVGMVGPHVSDLIAEGTLALEMGATLEDLIVTIHPHPTLSEAIMEAAEVTAGEPVHIFPQRKK